MAHKKPNPTRKTLGQRRWRQANRVRFLFLQSVSRCKKQKKQWALSWPEFEARLAPMRCEVSNLPLEWSETSYHPWMPSIDREDPSKGYTWDNVRVVCWMYNIAKQVNTDADVMRLAKALVEGVE